MDVKRFKLVVLADITQRKEYTYFIDANSPEEAEEIHDAGDLDYSSCRFVKNLGYEDTITSVEEITNEKI